MPGKAVDNGKSPWATAIRVGDQEGASGSWLHPSPVLILAVVCESVLGRALSFCLCHSTFQINIIKISESYLDGGSAYSLL